MMTQSAKLCAVILAAAAAACSDAPELEVERYSEPKSLGQQNTVAIDLAMLCSDVTVTDATGARVTGTRDCAGTVATCQNVGDLNCLVMDKNLYGLAKKDLKPENIKAGLIVKGVAGTLVTKEQTCTTDGESLCITTPALAAAKASDVASKVITGQKVGELSGEYQPDYPLPQSVLASALTDGRQGTIAACSGSSATGCLLGPGQGAADPRRIVPSHIKAGVTIDGVRGTFTTAAPNCSADGEANCLIQGPFIALDKSAVLSTNLESSYRVLGVTGQVSKAPGACTTDGQRDCVADTAFAAADRAALSAGIIRQGVQVAGITGAFPSAAYPLFAADPAVADLSAPGLAAALSRPAAFEFWDAAGQRHTGAGDAQLSAVHILTGKTIFSVGGALTASPADCQADNSSGCVATSGFPAIAKAQLAPANLRAGVTIAGVTGNFPSATAPLPGTAGHTELDFPSNLSGTGSRVFFDSTGQAHTIAAAADLRPERILAGRTVLGVLGTATAAPSPCASHNQTGCGASSGFPSYQAARVVPGHVKAAATIATPSGTVTGIFPSAAAPFAATAGVAQLTATNFATRLGSSAPFEFWDSAGVRQSFAGDNDFHAGNILATINLFGLQGTMRHQPAACSATLALECVTSAAFPSYDSNVLTANVIKTGTRIGAVTGIFPSAAAPFADASSAADLSPATFNQRLSSPAAFEYWTATGDRHTATGDGDLAVLSHLRSGITIFGRTGQAAVAPNSCGADGQTACLVQGPYRAIELSSLAASKLKNGVTVLGVTGAFPSAAHPLAGDSAAANLSSGQWQAAMASASTFEFWDAYGARHEAQGSALLKAENLIAPKAFYGVTGSMVVSGGPCQAAGVAGCTATASYPAYDKAALTEAVLKKDATVLGITGKFPSASYPMADGGFSGASLSANFNGALTSAATFQFWNSFGDRFEVAGDADIKPENIRTGKTIFGVAGTLNPAPELDVWDVLYGVNYTDSSGLAKTGKVKTNCRNMTDSQSNYKRLNTTTVYQDRNIDDVNGNRSRMPNENPFLDQSHECNGEAFTLVSPDPSTNSDCGSSNQCIYLDRIAKVMWASAVSTTVRANHGSALFSCRNLTWGGFNDWRLPSQKEALMAYVHGIRAISLAGNNASKFLIDRMTWTSTLSGEDTSTAYQVELSKGSPRLEPRTDATAYVHCIRSAP